MGIWFVPKLIPSFRLSHLASAALRFGVSGAVMAVCARFVADSVGAWTLRFADIQMLVAAILTGAVVYPVMLVLTKAVTRTDAKDAFVLLRNKQAAYAPTPAPDA